MTEQFLDEGDSPNLSDDDPLDFARELGIVDEEPLDISDLSEADKEKLAGLSDETSTLYNSSDIENYANGNEIITPNQAKELEELTGIFHNQTNNIVEKLPIEETIKKRLRNKLSEMSVRWTTFSGAGELLDIYETAVLLFYGLVAAAPELEKVANNYMIDLYNTMAEPYGIKVSRDKYKPDWEYIGQQFDNAEKITPTDILINKVMDKEVDETNYIEEKYQVKPATDVKFELGNTINNISTMPKKDKETLDTYDRIAKTFGNYGKKTG